MSGDEIKYRRGREWSSSISQSGGAFGSAKVRRALFALYLERMGKLAIPVQLHLTAAWGSRTAELRQAPTRAALASGFVFTPH